MVRFPTELLKRKKEKDHKRKRTNPNALPPPIDPWLIRKEPKKGKERKKKKKRRKSIDPDSIQSALLASGLGSTRPAFSAPVNPPAVPSIGE